MSAVLNMIVVDITPAAMRSIHLPGREYLLTMIKGLESSAPSVLQFRLIVLLQLPLDPGFLRKIYGFHISLRFHCLFLGRFPSFCLYRKRQRLK
jgi:hypothetical protein